MLHQPVETDAYQYETEGLVIMVPIAVNNISKFREIV
jgi:hypothetical protein